ncbi:MAG TPA: CDP-alcohol phosphatidyltransferase family protein [Burkholderiales bacterium]|nr:CDP-alcohol phosphatidyltransferase family protein [Burkholderiales bacterium]
MLDGLYAQRMNRVWDYLARGLARSGLSPNAITAIGLVLVAAGAAAYPFHRNSLVFGVWIALAFSFDALDGAVARLTGRSSKFGGYLDAVVDRYQELAVLAAIGWVHDAWPHALLVVSGSFLTSYNKARAAMEIPIDNGDWPDLVERLERILFVCALLVIGYWAPVVVPWGLVALGVLAHVTAVQRFFRARSRIAGDG